MLLRDIKPYIMFITHSLHVYFDHIQMLICSCVTINKTEVHTLWVMDWRMRYCKLTLLFVDCKTVGFFLKISKEIGKAWRKSLTRAKRASLTRPTGVWGERSIFSIFSVSPQSRSLFSASFQIYCLTASAYLNTQKYGLFCSLYRSGKRLPTIC